MVRARLSYLITLLIAVALHMAYAEYASQYILIALLSLPVLSLLLTACAAFFVRVGLTLPETVPSGVPVTLELCIKNKYFLPLARVSITYFRQNLFTGESETAQRLPCDACGNEMRVVELKGTHCGRCVVQVSRVGLHDYLGLFRIPLRRPAPVAYLSVPRSQATEKPFSPAELIPKRLMPKPGGGFAEEHELRAYRDGDSLSSIHWKLSSKLDELVIREPMIPEKQQIYLILEHCRSAEELDSVLGQLIHVSRELLELDIPHMIKCPFTKSQQLISADIASEQALKRYVARLLTSRAALSEGNVPAAAKSGRAHYVISPSKGGGDE